MTPPEAMAWLRQRGVTGPEPFGLLGVELARLVNACGAPATGAVIDARIDGYLICADLAIARVSRLGSGHALVELHRLRGIGLTSRQLMVEIRGHRPPDPQGANADG